MIRINLLGVAKAKKGKKPVIESSGGVSVLFIGVLIMAAAFLGGNYFYYSRIKAETVKIDTELRKAEAENRRLSDVKASYLEREKVKDNYKRRVDVIDQLRTAQTGPVSLLTMVGGTVNSVDEVWLSTMTDAGSTIELKGTALSVHGVADFMRKLQNSGYFKNVEIKETYQDASVKEIQAFVFTMTCEKAAQAPASAPATKTGTSAPAKSTGTGKTV